MFASDRWNGRATSRSFAIGAGAVLVIGGVGGFWLSRFSGLGALLFAGVMTLVAALCLVFTKVVVEVDSELLRVNFSYTGWPRLEIPRNEIRMARVVRIQPLRYGGWGYRGSLRLLRKAAVVVRAGPGVEFSLTGDRVLTVSVDDAEQCVDWLSRRRAPIAD